MLKKRITFVVNPKAGTRSKTKLEDVIAANLDSQRIDYQLAYTQHKKHATELAALAVEQGVDCVVAVGGDGTMNETASALVGTTTALAILPFGSGNGMARHLGIPLNIPRAIQLLNHPVEKIIDSCTLNDYPFFCVAGTGFDAYIGLKFDQQKTRGFQTYIKTTLREFFSYMPDTYKLTVNEQRFEQQAFLISFANAGQYGNNAYISPEADIADGRVDVCLLKPFPSSMAIPMGIQLFGKTIHTSSYLHVIPTQEVRVERLQAAPVHIDGEPMMMEATLEVKVKPASLRVWVKR